MRRSLRVPSLALASLALAACSLVNSLDELKPADDGKLAGDTRPAPSATLEDAGFGPTHTNGDAEAGAANDEAFSPLVVGGEEGIPVDGGAPILSPVLTVLDSKTGRERATRETMWVAGIAHDDVRDLWFVFEAERYVVTAPTEKVKIHVRRLDTKSGAWTELSVFEGPPLVYYDSIAVTRERLSYVAHPVTPGGKNRLITLDTSDPANPIVSDDQTLLDEMPRGMTAIPSLTGPGGNVNVFTVGRRGTAECEAVNENDTRCQVRVRRYLLPNGGTPQMNGSSLFGAMSGTGQPAYGSVICGGAPDDVIVTPGIGDQKGIQTITTLDYALSTQSGSRTFTMSTAIDAPTLLRRAAIDNPRRIVFVVEANNDTALYAVPLPPSTGEPQKINLRHSGQSVYYDPASETAFAPFNQGEGKTFSAIKVSGGKDGAAISLKERTSSEIPGGDWDPPADLRPNVLGISLTGQSCP